MLIITRRYSKRTSPLHTMLIFLKTIIFLSFIHVVERIVILGSGWGGFELCRKLDQSLFNVSVISPRNYFVFTPLLASTCVGTLEFRCITESVRSIKGTEYHQANCIYIDFVNRYAKVKSVLDDGKCYNVPYDKLVIATGMMTNTFGLANIHERAYSLRNVADSRRIRNRIIECFELAEQTGDISLLHFVIVGGGPTGVEFAAELHDFIRDDLCKSYYKQQSLAKYAKITIFDVAERILGAFDETLAAYAKDRFSRDGITVETKVRVKTINVNSITIQRSNEDLTETIKVGMVLWAAGLAPLPLYKNLQCASETHSGRLLVNDHLCLLQSKDSNEPIPNVFAIGDCAINKDTQLPCTAQVAKQQAQYLANPANISAETPSTTSSIAPFVYHPRGMMAYVGNWNAIVDLKTGKGEQKGGFSGRTAWLIWRSVYFSTAVSIRNKILIPTFWFLTWIFGRDMSKF